MAKITDLGPANIDFQLLNVISTFLQSTDKVQVGFRVDNYCFIMYDDKKFKITVEEITDD